MVEIMTMRRRKKEAMIIIILLRPNSQLNYR
jgi:hypothetical protein